jgi:hypothetical protein
MLDVGADDARGGLRSQGPTLPLRVATPGLDTEQLLLDHVGDGAHASLEHLGLLEHGCLDGLVAVARRQVSGDRLEAQERRPLGGQQVTGAPGGLGTGHRPRV